MTEWGPLLILVAILVTYGALFVEAMCELEKEMNDN